MKGLWFPIMTNLTNLAMDNQNIENKVFSMEILFQILEHGIQAFDLNFWREILSQVLFPMLEDIDLAIQAPIRKRDLNGEQFYLHTIQQIVSGFNDFFVKNIDKISYVIPSYVDILILFISQT